MVALEGYSGAAMYRLTTLERAYELARSGACLNVDDVARTLKREGYHDVRSQLSGPKLRRTLNALCYANKPEPPPASALGQASL
jgi:hypothetical protein